MYARSTLFGLLALSASASASLSHLHALKRQLGTTDIPPQCQDTCTPITNTVNTCTQLSCLCTDSVAQEIASCASCLAGLGGDVSEEQSAIDQYTNACITSGEPVSSIQLSSVSGAGSSTDSNASTTASNTSSTSSSTSTSSGSDASQTTSAGSDSNSGAVTNVFGMGVVAVGVAMGAMVVM